MRLRALSGDRAGALRHYARLRDILRQELDAEPDPASRQLYEQILARQFPAVAPASAPPLVALPPHNLPAPLTGRVTVSGVPRASVLGETVGTAVSLAMQEVLPTEVKGSLVAANEERVWGPHAAPSHCCTT